MHHMKQPNFRPLGRLSLGKRLHCQMQSSKFLQRGHAPHVVPAPHGLLWWAAWDGSAVHVTAIAISRTMRIGVRVISQLLPKSGPHTTAFLKAMPSAAGDGYQPMKRPLEMGLPFLAVSN